MLLIPIVIGISLLSFLVINVLPGDLAVTMLGVEGANADPEVLANIRADLGLDRPLHVQYLSWLGGVLRGDFGKSLVLKVEILPEILRRVPVTLELALLSVLFGLVVGVPLGVLAGFGGGRWDWLSRIIVSFGIGVPSFFIATLLLLFVAPRTPWIPVFTYIPFTQDPLRNLLSMIFPVTSLGIGLAMAMAENTRSAVLEVMRANYVTVAQAKGLRQRAIVWRHILRNASIPLISIVGLQLTFLFSGTIIIETIFSLPGLGKFVLTGINLRDYPVVQGVLFFVAVAVVLVNLITDMLYALADPRIRYE